MNIWKNEKFRYIFVFIFVSLIFVGVYFLYLYPKTKEISFKQSELSMQEQLLATLEGKQGSFVSEYDVKEMQKIVPVAPLTQQIILEIEKAEGVSGSFVSNMTFSEMNEVTERQIDSESESVLEENEEEYGTNNEDEGDVVETIHFPLGMKKVLIELNVQSPTYFEFEKFLSTLESLERMTVIEKIDFSANEEIIEEGQEIEPLKYRVILAVFYMPDLTDLIDSLPKIDTPPPANKRNPLPRFGDVS